MKGNGVTIVHVVQFLRAGGGRYYRPGYDIGKEAYAEEEEEHHHNEPDHHGIYIKVMSYTAAYTTKYFIVWVAQQAIVIAGVLLLEGAALGVAIGIRRAFAALAAAGTGAIMKIGGRAEGVCYFLHIGAVYGR